LRVEKLAYLIKQRMPLAFQMIAFVARGVVTLRFGRQLHRVVSQAKIEGHVHGEAAVIRPLEVADLEALHKFLAAQPEANLNYFRPHEFDRAALLPVLASHAFLSYGLFVGDRMVAYALLKVAPTGSAFIGVVVEPERKRLGLGQSMIRYLYWQASLARLRTRCTISRHNQASLRCVEAVTRFRVVAELPNDYLLIELPPGTPLPPVLEVD
jgi:hypothetical protein